MKHIYKAVIFSMLFCSCGEKSKVANDNKPAEQKYENNLFTLSYPQDCYIHESKLDKTSYSLDIGNDSLDDCMTTIIWESPNSFPGTEEQFVTVFAYKEMEEFKQSEKFYDIMQIDSTYSISGYNTYSIVSLFEENGDTIMQSRTGLIVPGNLDMMILQRANTKVSIENVTKKSKIIQSLKIK